MAFIDAVLEGWAVTDTKDDALATAAKAAAAGVQHAVKGVRANWSAAPSGNPLLTVKIGTTGVLVVPIPTAGRSLLFPDGIEGDFNGAVSAELAASGSGGVSGYLTLLGVPRGFSAPAQQACWSVPANATHATATATKTGVSGKRHGVRGVVCGWSGTITGLPTCTIKLNGSAVLKVTVPQAGLELWLDDVLGSADGTDVSAELTDGGVGIVGYVNLVGVSE